MTKGHTIGTRAAIGGLTATIALLTALPASKADELADLRANQELLQRRIEQLAQGTKAYPGVPGAMGAEATPGAPLAGGSFPRSFLIPGTETSIRLGGFIDITSLYFLSGGGNVPGSNAGSNSGQNGTLEALPLNGPIVVPGLANQAQPAAHSRGNGVFEFSPQQTRWNIETRTPTAWGEARTFIESDFSTGCNNFSCQTLQQAGGNSLIPRLRFAYGTLGGFLGGQALSNFSDADADTESMEFGGAMGSTGGYRVPQVRYTLAGPYGSAFSVSAEQPTSSVLTPAGVLSSDTVTSALPGGPGSPTIPATCNGQPCTGAGGVAFNPGRQFAPVLTAASYWAQPWGHVDFAALLNPLQYNDGRFIDQKFLGYGGHISGDVKPFSTAPFGLPGAWAKDDFLFSFVAGEGIGNYASGGEKTLIPMASNFTVQTSCVTPVAGCTGGMAASNVLFRSVFGYSANGGYQHWWAPNLRSTIAAGFAHQDISSQLIGPTQAIAANKELWNAFVNLVWSPVAFITTGVEYMYGQRRVVSNAKGQENVLIGKFRVAF
jgi:Porin subfamily